MPSGREGFWTFAVAAVVTLFLLDVVGFAQAKVKKKKMQLSSDIHELVVGQNVPFHIR